MTISPIQDIITQFEKFQAEYTNNVQQNRQAIDLHVKLDRAIDEFADDEEIVGQLEAMNSWVLEAVFRITAT